MIYLGAKQALGSKQEMSWEVLLSMILIDHGASHVDRFLGRKGSAMLAETPLCHVEPMLTLHGGISVSFSQLQYYVSHLMKY